MVGRVEWLAALLLIPFRLLHVVDVEPFRGTCSSSELATRNNSFACSSLLSPSPPNMYRMDKKGCKLTTISLPIEILLWIAMTFIIQPLLLFGRTMGKGDMPIRDIVKEMDFFFFQGQGRGDGVYGGVPPTLVEEPAVLVELCEVIDIRFGA